ncbi:MAG: hypothetical protein Q9174_005908, partial [Haloplaca sp. 1 TL-2023]
ICSLDFEVRLSSSSPMRKAEAIKKTLKVLFASRDGLGSLSQCLEEHRIKMESTVAEKHGEALTLWNEKAEVVRRDLENWKVEMEIGMFCRGPVEIEVLRAGKEAPLKSGKE